MPYIVRQQLQLAHSTHRRDHLIAIVAHHKHLDQRGREEDEVQHNILHVRGRYLKASEADHQRGGYKVPQDRKAEDVVHLLAETV